MTYDLLDSVAEDQLGLTLPFVESQALGYQFWCIVGAQESNLPVIERGVWEGFRCSLDEIESPSKVNIKNALRGADSDLLDLIDRIDFDTKFEDGSTPLINYMVLSEHEAHHQGQMINFIYAHNLPIPESWFNKWHLTRE
jgi:hypothetical protein